MPIRISTTLTAGRVRTLQGVLAAGIVLALGCKGGETEEPEDVAGSNLLDPSVSSSQQMAGAQSEDLAAFDNWDEPVEVEPWPELPPRGGQVKKCRGKGKKRECKMVDAKPKVSAAHGVRTLMGQFRWGMDPGQVLRVLAQDIQDEYRKRQEKATNAVEQDKNRAWREDQIQRLKANHQKFASTTNHKWGVSLIQYEYEDDANEEMLWARTSPTLRKYYFFKDNALWKILYAYSTDTWQGESYEEVVETKFMKWFGSDPELKVKQDPETAEPLVRYYEWEALGGEKIRSFDMTKVHGVIALAVVDGAAEARIGERLPNRPRKEDYSEQLQDVMGGTDVCYDKSGDIVKCDNPSGYVE